MTDESIEPLFCRKCMFVDGSTYNCEYCQGTGLAAIPWSDLLYWDEEDK